MKQSTKYQEIVYRDVYNEDGKLLIKGAVFMREIIDTFLGVGKIQTNPCPIVRDIGEFETTYNNIRFSFHVRKLISRNLDYIIIIPDYFGLLPIRCKARMCLEEKEGMIVETWKLDLRNEFLETKDLILRVPNEFKPIWIIPFTLRKNREDTNIPKYVFVKGDRMYKPPTPNSFDNGDLCLGYSTVWDEPKSGEEIDFASRFMEYFFNNSYNSDLYDSNFCPVFNLGFGRLVGDIRPDEFKPILNEELHNMVFASSL